MKYIILRNSSEQSTWIADTNIPKTETGHRFRVIQGGFIPSFKKAQTLDQALDGTLDMSVGSVRYNAKYTIRVEETLSTEYDPLGALVDQMGSMSDLKAYFILNNPVGTISTLIHLVDHYGTEYDGYLVGDHAPQPLTTLLSGADAHYTVQIEFISKDKVA